MKRTVGNRQSAVGKQPAVLIVDEIALAEAVAAPEVVEVAVSIAWCWRSGEIAIVPVAGAVVPGGAIVIAAGPDEALRAAIEGNERLAYDGTTWLVPGVPEAESDAAAGDALEAFQRRVRKSLGAAAAGVRGWL